MKNKILLYLTILLSVVLGCIRSFNCKTSFFVIAENSIEEQKQTSTLIAVKNVIDNTIDNYDIEDYLIGVVAGEMPASFNEEALKAQAVAARTYAYYKIENAKENFDITNDASTQVHLTNEQMYNKWLDDFNKYYEKIKKAVNDTKGEVITYNNKIIPAYYFAMSNGYTENSELVFNEEKDYLKSVPSPEKKENYEFVFVMKKDDFCAKLQINCEKIEVSNIKRTKTNRITSITINNQEYTGKAFKYLLDIRSTDFDLIINDDITIITRGYGHGVGINTDFNILNRSSSGRIVDIEINSITYSGVNLRSLLGLRSTDFVIEKNNDGITFTTKGYGHGVGMSQYGANNLASSGFSYHEILSHYYTNTKITNIGSII